MRDTIITIAAMLIANGGKVRASVDAAEKAVEAAADEVRKRELRSMTPAERKKATCKKCLGTGQTTMVGGRGHGIRVPCDHKPCKPAS